MTPSLSICIPTFNRRHYLDELLASLAPQVDCDVELVISDNASTDGTAEMVDAWRHRLPLIRYHRWDTNRGADSNYLSCVELASGRYCWFIGSDDIAAADAVATIREGMTKGADCMLFARDLRTRDMVPLGNHSFWSFTNDRIFDFSRQPLRDYFELSTSLCALFSYLSSIVFRRDFWMQDTSKERLVGSAYAHADILLRQLERGGSLLASSTTVVRCRCGNDSFSDGNKGKRLSLDFDGYARIAESLPDATDGLGLMRILVREHPWRNLIHVLRHKRAVDPVAERSFLDLLARLGVARHRLAWYRIVATTPWFEMFLRVEPLFKKDGPLVKMKRRLRQMVGPPQEGAA